jgi:hypothetical protein
MPCAPLSSRAFVTKSGEVSRISARRQDVRSGLEIVAGSLVFVSLRTPGCHAKLAFMRDMANGMSRPAPDSAGPS